MTGNKTGERHEEVPGEANSMWEGGELHNPLCASPAEIWDFSTADQWAIPEMWLCKTISILISPCLQYTMISFLVWSWCMDTPLTSYVPSLLHLWLPMASANGLSASLLLSIFYFALCLSLEFLLQAKPWGYFRLCVWFTALGIKVSVCHKERSMSHLCGCLCLNPKGRPNKTLQWPSYDVLCSHCCTGRTGPEPALPVGEQT